jgi:septum formation protein
VPQYSLVLASASPRRAQLLQSAGIPFTLAPSNVEEPPPSAEEESHPAQYVEKLAQHKAAACDANALSLPQRPLILAADTIVWHGGKILGKPQDAAEARAMLGRLCGETHHVFTGVCLRDGEQFHTAHDKTQVTFYERDAAWIARYVQTGEPMDKAGSYAAQGIGSFLLRRIEGDFANVVGLPLGLLGQMFEALGIEYGSWWDMSHEP